MSQLFYPSEGSLDSHTVGGWIGSIPAAAILEKRKICTCSTLSIALDHPAHSHVAVPNVLVQTGFSLLRK
jgi:hypothetical protein